MQGTIAVRWCAIWSVICSVFRTRPEKRAVYRALVESCEQVQDDACALKYSEQLIALRPDDSEIMMLAVGLLQKQGDEASLTRASGYVSRVLDRIDKIHRDGKASAGFGRPNGSSITTNCARRSTICAGRSKNRSTMMRLRKKICA